MHTLKIIKITFILLIIAISYNSSAESNSIVIGSSKFNNTLNFIANANYSITGAFGRFAILNKYEGTAMDNIPNSFRDNETLWTGYSYPISKHLFLTAEAKYNIIADMNIEQDNQLMRLSGIAGISGSIADVATYKLLAGIEDNKQSGIKATGSLFKANAEVNNWDIDGYLLNSSLSSELLFLSDNRSSKDIDVNAGIGKTFSKDEQFQVNIRYKMQGRDFVQNNYNMLSDTNRIVEANVNNRISANIIGNWILAEGYLMSVDGGVENINVHRNYNALYETINYSYVDRYYNELSWNIKAEAIMQHSNSIPVESKIAILVTNRNEQNYLEPRYDIDNLTLTNLQSLEAQKDNTSLTTGLQYYATATIRKTDTLQLKLSLMKTEYDTPSNANNDDRDELNHIASLTYIRKFSKILTVIASLNYSQNHLVFIHKERSSQNNWNRILGLNTGVRISTEKVLYFPQFEVLANYSVYDFETNLNKPRSYSYRHITYKDTLSIQLHNKYFISNKITARLYEQGKLYWSAFAELPQQRNIELSANPMLYYKFNEQHKLGLGGRIFNLNNSRYTSTSGFINSNDIISLSPEINYSIKFNRVTLNCNGWLEYRFQNSKFDKVIPNFYINTAYNF
ncbi:MAG: hypothetical protein LBO69_09920 [Ignavibacteria bacterium]|jgi:hypothetical protein|nr:hypothetical protein [Ignavibacteria bacterium]